MSVLQRQIDDDREEEEPWTRFLTPNLRRYYNKLDEESRGKLLDSIDIERVAIIDADYIIYKFASLKDNETGELVELDIVLSLVEDYIAEILNQSEATYYVVTLTPTDGTFRNRVCTILPYKGNRQTEKPPYYNQIREYLLSEHFAVCKEMLEADDLVSILVNDLIDDTDIQYVVCHIDKDLDMIPGDHLKFDTWEHYHISEIEGLRNFYKQMLTGDKQVDNILGLYGVGPKSALVTKLDDMDNELDMYIHVRDRYKERFGNYWDKFMHETAMLLWLVTAVPEISDESMSAEIVERLTMLEGLSNE